MKINLFDSIFEGSLKNNTSKIKKILKSRFNTVYISNKQELFFSVLKVFNCSLDCWFSPSLIIISVFGICIYQKAEARSGWVRLLLPSRLERSQITVQVETPTHISIGGLLFSSWTRITGWHISTLCSSLNSLEICLYYIEIHDKGQKSYCHLL